MKIFGKILSFLFILIILSFSIFSVMGYSYYLGDNKITVMKGAKDLKLSTDLDGGVKLSIKPASADEATGVRDVIERRIALLGLVDYSLYVQDSTGNVELVLPEDIKGDYEAIDLAAFLTCPGYVTLRPDSVYQEIYADTSDSPAFFNYDGTTAQSILLNSDYITSASSLGSDSFEISFNSEGSAVLSQISNPNLSSDTVTSYYNSTVSLWIDNRMIAFRTLDEHFDSGSVYFTDESFTSFKTELFAAVIDSGRMPCDISVEEISDADSVSGGAPVKMILIVAAVLLFALAFFAIYRYRLGGVITSVCMIFAFSLLLAQLTGFFPDSDAFVLNIPAVCAWMISLLLTAMSCMLICEKIKQNISAATPVSSAVKIGFKQARPLILDISVVLVIISVAGMFIFGGSDFAVTLFGNSLCGGIYRFCDVLFWGTVINLAAGLVLPGILIYNFKNFRFLAKAKMFGGKEK